MKFKLVQDVSNNNEINQHFWTELRKWIIEVPELLKSETNLQSPSEMHLYHLG